MQDRDELEQFISHDKTEVGKIKDRILHALVNLNPRQTNSYLHFKVKYHLYTFLTLKHLFVSEAVCCFE